VTGQVVVIILEYLRRLVRVNKSNVDAYI
jgi:hypothetical protein